MWKIGDININGRVVLAPMAGYTSFGYRSFYENFGACLTYTEMVSDMGLIYQNKETLDYINFPESDVPTIVQLFGNDENNLAKAGKIIKDKLPFVKIIDINMACPVKKVTKNCSGSSLLNDIDKIKRIVSTLKKETGLYITAKIRLGIDDKNINFLEVIKALEESGISMIALHARTAKDLYYGKPRYELIKNLRDKMSVPLIVSGNIFSLNDAIEALNISKADAIMVARGSIGNPFLIKQIDHYLKTSVVLKEPSIQEKIEMMKSLALSLIKEKGEEKAMRVFRSMAPSFLSGFAKSKKYRNRLAMELVTYQSLIDIINDMKSELGI